MLVMAEDRRWGPCDLIVVGAAVVVGVMFLVVRACPCRALLIVGCRLISVVWVFCFGCDYLRFRLHDQER